MKKSDAELINKLKEVFKQYLDDQAKSSPLHKVRDLPGDIHGHLADLVFIDKVQNDVLVGFITGMVYGDRSDNDKETLKRLKDIYSVLCSFNTVDINQESEEAPNLQQQELEKQHRLDIYNEKLQQAKENGWERPEKPEDI